MMVRPKGSQSRAHKANLAGLALGAPSWLDEARTASAPAARSNPDAEIRSG